MGGQRSKCTRGGGGCKRNRAEGDGFLGAQHRLEAASKASARPVVAPAPGTTAGQVDQGKARQNAGKPPMHLVPLDGLVLVAWVLAFGAEKYEPRGWEKAAAEGLFSWADCARAIMSHLSKLLAGQRLDRESGLPHIAHIGCNALFLCAMLARKNGKDDLAELVPPPGFSTPLPCSAEWEPGPEFHEAVAKARQAREARA